MDKIQRQIDKRLEEIRELRRKQEQAKAENKKSKIAKPKGRPGLKKEIILKAKLLALSNPLPLVALKLNISLKTLYNYGISREALNKEIGL